MFVNCRPLNVVITMSPDHLSRNPHNALTAAVISADLVAERTQAATAGLRKTIN